jgi:hypothetical protein
LYSHLYDAKCGIKNYRCNWIRSLLAKGFLPTIRLIGEVDGNGSREEIAWIAYGRNEGWRLVNETDGGEGLAGCSPSAETRAKMSIAHKGARGPWLGRHLSPKTCAKMSIAGKGRSFSPETRAKISAAKKGILHPMFGKRHSPESIAKMSLAIKNWWATRKQLALSQPQNLKNHAVS